MSSSDAQASPERCRCDAYEVPNRSGALFPGDGKVHTWLLCQPTAGRTPSSSDDLELLPCGCLPDEDHTKPHWCHHDGGDALVPPPGWLFYVGKKWSDDKLETRDCSHVAAPRVVDVVEAL